MIWRRFSAVVVAATLAQGCSVRPEETIVGDFFAASRLRDLTALSRFATVVFEPRERGTVAVFSIRGVSAERVEGRIPVKDVVIDASVRDPAGNTARKVLVVRLERRGSAPEGPSLYGGWIVTGVTDG
jgi:hypothetical protein